MITFTSDQTGQLTVFKAEGLIQLADVKDTLEKFYRDQPTLRTIWDLTRADFSGTTLDHIEELAKFVKGLAHSREGGKNAFISSEAFAYSLGKMYQLFAEQTRQSTQTRIFKTRAEADNWLSS